MRSTISAQEGIEELFELYANDIYRYALYSAPESADAKDVVQEVFLRAYKSWGNFRADANERTWLIQIAKNYIYDLLRKKRVETEYRKKHQPNLSDVSVPLETLVELEDAVTKLKRDQRQVFVLRCIQDLSIAETASILSWTQSKVKTTLHRAMKELRLSLRDFEYNTMPVEEGESSEYGRGDQP